VFTESRRDDSFKKETVVLLWVYKCNKN